MTYTLELLPHDLSAKLLDHGDIDRVIELLAYRFWILHGEFLERAVVQPMPNTDAPSRQHMVEDWLLEADDHARRDIMGLKGNEEARRGPRPEAQIVETRER